MAVSADAVFAAVAAWGLAASRWPRPRPAGGCRLGGAGRAAARRRRDDVLRPAAAGRPGRVAVLVAGRSWRPLPVAAAAALAVVLAFAAAGFAWWEAYPVLRSATGTASPSRPAAASYWLWGDLAALLVCAGPAARRRARGRCAPRCAARRRPRGRAAGRRGRGAGGRCSPTCPRMSKAEVERIWLPFVPWLTARHARCCPTRWRRWGSGSRWSAAAAACSTCSTRAGDGSRLRRAAGAWRTPRSPSVGRAPRRVKPSSQLARCRARRRRAGRRRAGSRR